VVEDRYTVYLDGGAGLQHSGESIPADGTNFNFRPQVGIGFTWHIDENIHLMSGARWLHISNAGINGDDQNPGFDGAQVYAGVSIPF
ncbi:MAG: acyloxyacyl hydrolase, partial [Phycisphaeraceae bacterium]|nr:acyloxyacyl hydrolase [Phycisphaeraceae bacterium]